MKYLFFILIILFSLTACHQGSGISAYVQDADSVAINFFKGDGSMDSVTKVVILGDKEKVKQLANYIDNNVVDDKKCGYDASLHFFKNNIVLKDVQLRMNDAQCMHFSFVQDGKTVTTRLSPEAKTFIDGLRK